MDYSGKIIRKTPVVPSQTSASGVWSLDEALQATKSNTWPVANVPNPISRSLRFRASASAYLNRTFTSTGNRKTWTWSGWVKLGLDATSSDRMLFSGTTNGTTTIGTLFFDGGSSRLRYIDYTSSPVSFQTNIVTTSVYRDPSAWYHIVLAVDTTQATASNRFKFYVNGIQITSFETASYPAQNTDTFINAAQQHRLGSYPYSSPNFDGYMTEVNFIDGQALTPSSFGGTNAVTGVWEPRVYTGTYGTNGFLLPFSNITSTATLGNDFSGNNNTWTTNNISLTAGSTYDSMLDVPTQWIGYNTGDVASVTRGNYPTLNPLKNYQNPSNTLSAANLNFQAPPSNGQFGQTQCTMALPPIGSTGKYYYEVTWSAVFASDYNQGMGIMNVDSTSDYAGLDLSTNTRKNRSGTTTALGVTISNGDTIQIAVDCATSSIWFGRNNTWYEGNPSAGTGASFTNLTSGVQYTGYVGTYRSGANNVQGDINFGQRPFSYTPPAGFLSLCTTNLPNPTILQGNQYMDISLYSATGSTPQTITNSGGFQPDLVWTKPRSSVGENALNDSVRGASKLLITSSTAAEATDAQYVTSFNSNGYSLGTNNWSGTTVVGWQWRASGSTVSNTAGSITSTVSANQTAGFSIATYTGNGTGGATIGHGLGVAPRMVIVKARTGTNIWAVYHASMNATPQAGLLYLNQTNAYTAASSVWNNTAPSSSVFSVGTDLATNQNTTTYVAYCFAAVPGYSAFGGYTGNGSSDGPFVYLGFRPRYVMIKSSSNTTLWYVYDSARNTFNLTTQILYPNLSDAEATGVNSVLDFVSNGFKIRDPGIGEINISGATFIYACFAENPFKNALAR
jgi:hypothetical protein